MKDVLLDANNSIAKIKYCSRKTAFQHRGSPPSPHCLIKFAASLWFFDFFKTFIPFPKTNSMLCNLVKSHLINSHSKTCRKFKKSKCRFKFLRFFCDRTMVSVPLNIDEY